ncbi:hypothetical protein ARMSODRAFT_952215 [Armillaria solidipes]|uniref:Uncharacterized protein n=1 Tax=Armillaria solidipes TaxID=1076256 RepID=A0A2H3CCR0_9AGAR|nr:hypothetical protein ARMSODRAFT_952215 [Armillaria solidipes]
MTIRSVDAFSRMLHTARSATRSHLSSLLPVMPTPSAGRLPLRPHSIALTTADRQRVRNEPEERI